MSQVQQHRFQLDESEMPTRWYNVLHDLPTPPPPVLHPGTGQPVGPDDLAPLFPMELIMQEVATEQYVDIPDGVLEDLKERLARTRFPSEIENSGWDYGTNLSYLRDLVT